MRSLYDVGINIHRMYARSYLLEIQNISQESRRTAD